MVSPEFHVVIPARMASSRLPGKPLIDLGGKPMIVRVAERAKQSGATSVIIGTDHKDIETAIENAGYEVCLTNSDHRSGSDRVLEVVDQYEFSDDSIVVNVQGDEPLIPPAVITQVAVNLIKNSGADLSTLCQTCPVTSEASDPNIVKVIRARTGMALYFSRSLVPHDPNLEFQEQQNTGETVYRRHIGIYAYWVRTLRKFVDLPTSELEERESLEQLRFLENGFMIGVEETCESVPAGVDTLEDVKRIRTILERNE